MCPQAVLDLGRIPEALFQDNYEALREDPVSEFNNAFLTVGVLLQWSLIF